MEKKFKKKDKNGGYWGLNEFVSRVSIFLMSKERKSSNGRPKNGKAAERMFTRLLSEVGFEVDNNPPSIRCDESPVENTVGDKVKVVTQPDRKVTHPATKEWKLVEVTKGNGQSSHKEAQMRVVKEAGMEDCYEVVSGDEIEQIGEVFGDERFSLIETILKFI